MGHPLARNKRVQTLVISLERSVDMPIQYIFYTAIQKLCPQPFIFTKIFNAVIGRLLFWWAQIRDRTVREDDVVPYA